MKRIVFASNNAHKLSEIKALLRGQFELVSLAEIGFTEEIPETSETIEGNAIQKAQYLFDRLGVPVFADDSGLEIKALDGRPGVDSAHYSGSRDADANMNLVLQQLEHAADRSARFITVIAYAGSGVTSVFEGSVRGEIGLKKSGENGFGYDPIFLPEGGTRSFGEMSSSEKSVISHRARALKKFVEFLESA